MTYHSNMFFKLKNSGIIIGYGGSTGRVTTVDPFPTLYPDLKESTVILSITDFSQEEINLTEFLNLLHENKTRSEKVPAKRGRPRGKRSGGDPGS